VLSRIRASRLRDKTDDKEEIDEKDLDESS
jgi:hypothetical protein